MVRTIIFCCAGALAVTATAQELVRGEYYFDVDPGFGNGAPINFTQAAEVTLPLALDVSALPPGAHLLGVRMKDDSGHWGFTNRRFFMVRSMAPGGDIVRFEYFLDSDPGFGNGTAVNAGPAPEVNAVLVDVLTAGLPAGPHTLFMRSLSSNGAWSLTNTWTFDVLVGIAELERWGITAGPNPMRDRFVLQRADAGATIEVEMLDAQGRRVFSDQWSGDRLVIATEGISAGLLFLVLRQVDADPLVLKLVKP